MALSIRVLIALLELVYVRGFRCEEWVVALILSGRLMYRALTGRILPMVISEGVLRFLAISGRSRESRHHPHHEVQLPPQLLCSDLGCGLSCGLGLAHGTSVNFGGLKLPCLAHSGESFDSLMYGPASKAQSSLDPSKIAGSQAKATEAHVTLSSSHRESLLVLEPFAPNSSTPQISPTRNPRLSTPSSNLMMFSSPALVDISLTDMCHSPTNRMLEAWCTDDERRNRGRGRGRGRTRVRMSSDVWVTNSLGTSDFPTMDSLEHCAEMLETWSRATFKQMKKRKWLENRIWELQQSVLSSEGHSELSRRREELEDVWQLGKEEIHGIISRYFSKLFTSTSPSPQELDSVHHDLTSQI
ncbi:hypothetical protein Salat_0680400 [Sesamum alatum]|uniref:Uncharacterized protein n=1 Tax=Sesamum alatum TaxID=300844 RepID=A0AAE2CUK7_9LAMI|nr:hypothetical protein Salat_0680400 [Sesamum alatum]